MMDARSHPISGVFSSAYSTTSSGLISKYLVKRDILPRPFHFPCPVSEFALVMCYPLCDSPRRISPCIQLLLRRAMHLRTIRNTQRIVIEMCHLFHVWGLEICLGHVLCIVASLVGLSHERFSTTWPSRSITTKSLGDSHSRSTPVGVMTILNCTYIGLIPYSHCLCQGVGITSESLV